QADGGRAEPRGHLRFPARAGGLSGCGTGAPRGPDAGRLPGGPDGPVGAGRCPVAAFGLRGPQAVAERCALQPQRAALRELWLWSPWRMRIGVLIAVLAMLPLPGAAMAQDAVEDALPVASAQARQRVQIAPYIEAAQVLTAELAPGNDVVTYTMVAAGVDGSVVGRNS